MPANITKIMLLAAMLPCAYTCSGQQGHTLSLPEAQALARQHYPLAKEHGLIEKSLAYTLENAQKAYLPNLVLNGQATYQSTVTALPLKIPGQEIPVLSKDQYRLYAELVQPLYDGGMARQQKKMIETGSRIEEQKLEVEMYTLTERVNQLYFSILLTEGQLRQIELMVKDLTATLHKTRAAVQNGAALKSSASLLSAEKLKAEQRLVELHSSRRAYLQMLGLFINRTLEEDVVLILPDAPMPGNDINRPELILLEHQVKMSQLQQEAFNIRNRPRFNLFIQGGFGRPALNMLSNEFEPYYLGGIRMSWSLTGLYTLQKDRAINDLSRQGIEVKKELFVFNTNIQLSQQQEEIRKYEELLRTDTEIITLRREIKLATESQLENGVISSADYLREVYAEQQAAESRLLHEIQYLMALYRKLTITGHKSTN